MVERTVLRMGDPDLHRIASPVSEFATPALDALVRDLWETMAARGGVGLAATQIGELQRVVVFGVEHSERYPDAPPIPFTVLVNPEIEFLDDALVDGWEGCLSLPGLRGLVPRCHHVRYAGLDERGGRIERETEGFHARLVQHECDHLDGVLYPMRMCDMSQFGFDEEINLAGRDLTSSATTDREPA